MVAATIFRVKRRIVVFVQVLPILIHNVSHKDTRTASVEVPLLFLFLNFKQVTGLHCCVCFIYLKHDLNWVLDFLPELHTVFWVNLATMVHALLDPCISGSLWIIRKDYCKEILDYYLILIEKLKIGVVFILNEFLHFTLFLVSYSLPFLQFDVSGSLRFSTNTIFL